MPPEHQRIPFQLCASLSPVTLLRRPPTAAELLRGVAGARGWVVGSGLPDEARAGRLLLKDYTDGRLLHCEHPPSTEPSSHAEVADSASSSGSSSGYEEEEEDREQAGTAGAEHSAAGVDVLGRHAEPHSSSAGRDAASQEGGRPPGEPSASGEDHAGASSAEHGAAAALQRANLPVDSASELGEADLDLLESMRLGKYCPASASAGAALYRVP